MRACGGALSRRLPSRPVAEPRGHSPSTASRLPAPKVRTAEAEHSPGAPHRNPGRAARAAHPAPAAACRSRSTASPRHGPRAPHKNPRAACPRLPSTVSRVPEPKYCLSVLTAPRPGTKTLPLPRTRPGPLPPWTPHRSSRARNPECPAQVPPASEHSPERSWAAAPFFHPAPRRTPGPLAAPPYPARSAWNPAQSAALQCSHSSGGPGANPDFPKDGPWGSSAHSPKPGDHGVSQAEQPTPPPTWRGRLT